MLDIKFIRENLEKVKRDTKNKNKEVDFDKLLLLDEQRKLLKLQMDESLAKRNEIAQKMQKERDEKLIEEGKKIKEKSTVIEKEYEEVNNQFLSILMSIPNVVDEDVVVGKDESENVVLRKWGEPKEFNFPVKDHIEIGKELDLIDIEKSSEITGARFFYLKNEAVLIQFGIIQLVLETLTNEDIIAELAKKVGNSSENIFTPMIVPMMVKPTVMKKMDRLDPIDERYLIPSDDLVLVGSAEHTLGRIHMDEILDYKDLPIRYIGYSSAFRREAGSYGKDVRGLNRLHQFDKVEIVQFALPSESYNVLDEMVLHVEKLIQSMNMPYRILRLCGGDMSFASALTYDFEVFSTAQQRWLEVSSVSNFETFQTNRAKVRYKDENGKTQLVHSLNGSSLALPRILACLLENNQTAEGIKIPSVLIPYTGFDLIN